jgi:hypothetical protein
MKVFVQNEKTSRFLAAQRDAWTAEISDAFDFKMIIPAIDFCASDKFSTLGLVVSFKDQMIQVRLNGSTDRTARRGKQVWKPAIRQIGKSALRRKRLRLSAFAPRLRRLSHFPAPCGL